MLDIPHHKRLSEVLIDLYRGAGYSWLQRQFTGTDLTIDEFNRQVFHFTGEALSFTDWYRLEKLWLILHTIIFTMGIKSHPSSRVINKLREYINGTN